MQKKRNFYLQQLIDGKILENTQIFLAEILENTQIFYNIVVVLPTFY